MVTGKGTRKALTALAAVFALALCARAEDGAPARQAEDKAAAQGEYEPPSKPEVWARGIHKGYRGTTLPVSGHQVMFLNKGDRVDVLVTFEANMKGGVKEKVTATILQNCIVVDLHKPTDPEKMGVVQLMLNPNEAQYAGLARIQGELHVTLRGTGDTQMEPMEMASFRKLFR